MLEVHTTPPLNPHDVEPGHDPHPQPPTDPGHRPDPPKKHPDTGPRERPEGMRKPVKSAHAC
jgi:hypothetical protein